VLDAAGFVPGERLFRFPLRQCDPVNVIQHCQVGTDKSVTMGTPLTGTRGATSGPGHALLRYTLDQCQVVEARMWADLVVVVSPALDDGGGLSAGAKPFPLRFAYVPTR